jgi:hypothetical protein
MVVLGVMKYSQITGDLFIGTTPSGGHYAELREKGVALVINMRMERRPRPDPGSPPVRSLWLPTLDTPLIPIPIHVLERGAKAALKVIDTGGRVYVHCAAGRHRGVAMGAAILIAQGYSAAGAMQLIKQQRVVADPYIWYIRRRIERFAQRWQSRRAGHFAKD